ncbi:vezatin-like [Glandiceps talaboti]
MSNLLSDQGSEFIRRLTMCFCMEAYEDVKHWSENELYQSLDNILTISDAAMEDCLNLLQKSYNFHRIGILEKDDEKNVRFNRKETALPGGDVLVAVHSLELHLQVALKRVRNCQEKIESLTDIDVIKAQGDTLSADLSQLQTDLDACKGCLDEGSVRLYRLLGKSSGQGQDTPTAKPTECNENEGNRKSEKEPIPLFGLPEPDIEFDDQIFEGYTDPIEIEGTEWDYEPMTVEEREQRKRQKEESVRMLSELRSVLAVRTTERERLKQEKQAKKQNQSHAVTDAKAPSLDSCFEDVDTLKLGESKMIVLDASEERLRGGKDISTDQEKCSSTAAWTSDDPLMQGMPSTENPHGMDGQSSIQCHSGDEVRSHLKTTGVTAAVMSLSQEECADTTDRQSERVYDELFSQDCSNCDDKEKNEDSDDKAPLLPSVVSRERLLAKLGQGQVFNITSSIAAQAARKSHNLNLQVQTFGDEFDDGEDFLEG